MQLVVGVGTVGRVLLIVVESVHQTHGSVVGVLVGDVEGVINVDGVVFADGSSKVLDSLVGIL